MESEFKPKTDEKIENGNGLLDEEVGMSAHDHALTRRVLLKMDIRHGFSVSLG